MLIFYTLLVLRVKFAEPSFYLGSMLEFDLGETTGNDGASWP